MANENEKKWYFAIDGRTSDPMTFEELRAFVQNGELLPDTFVFNSDESEKGWRKASDTEVGALFAAPAGQIPPLPPFSGAQTGAALPRSEYAAGSAGMSAEFTVGGILSGTWSMMWKKPFAFMGLTFLSSFIAVIFAFICGLAGAMIGVTATPQGSLGAGLSFIVLLGVSAYYLTMMFFQGVITFTVFRVFMSGAVSVWESMKRSISRVWAVCLGALCVMAAFILIGLLCLILPGILGALIGSAGITAIAIIIGLIAFLVIGSVYFVKWIVLAPACVIERLGPLAGLNRSARLTKGYGWKIYGIFSLVFVIMIIFILVTGFLVSKLLGPGIISGFVNVLVNLIPLTFLNVLIPVIYYSLRVTKEQLTPESLADIFD